MSVSLGISGQRRLLRCIGGESYFIHFVLVLILPRTWILTTEEVTEPPKRLAEECKKIGIDNGDFLVSDIGETKYF